MRNFFCLQLVLFSFLGYQIARLRSLAAPFAIVFACINAAPTAWRFLQRCPVGELSCLAFLSTRDEDRDKVVAAAKNSASETTGSCNTTTKKNRVSTPTVNKTARQQPLLRGGPPPPMKNTRKDTSAAQAQHQGPLSRKITVYCQTDPVTESVSCCASRVRRAAFGGRIASILCSKNGNGGDENNSNFLVPKNSRATLCTLAALLSKIRRLVSFVLLAASCYGFFLYAKLTLSWLPCGLPTDKNENHVCGRAVSYVFSGSKDILELAGYINQRIVDSREELEGINVGSPALEAAAAQEHAHVNRLHTHTTSGKIKRIMWNQNGFDFVIPSTSTALQPARTSRSANIVPRPSPATTSIALPSSPRPSTSIAGSMSTLGALRQFTKAPLIVHPHYESEELRRRVQFLYSGLYHCTTPEVFSYQIMKPLHARFVVIDNRRCFFTPFLVDEEYSSKIKGSNCDRNTEKQFGKVLDAETGEREKVDQFALVCRSLFFNPLHFRFRFANTAYSLFERVSPDEGVQTVNNPSSEVGAPSGGSIPVPQPSATSSTTTSSTSAASTTSQRNYRSYRRVVTTRSSASGGGREDDDDLGWDSAGVDEEMTSIATESPPRSSSALDGSAIDGEVENVKTSRNNDAPSSSGGTTRRAAPPTRTTQTITTTRGPRMQKFIEKQLVRERKERLKYEKKREKRRKQAKKSTSTSGGVLADSSTFPFFLDSFTSTLSLEESLLSEDYWAAIIQESDADCASFAELAQMWFSPDSREKSPHLKQIGIALMDALEKQFASTCGRDPLVVFMKGRYLDYNFKNQKQAEKKYGEAFEMIHQQRSGLLEKTAHHRSKSSSRLSKKQQHSEVKKQVARIVNDIAVPLPVFGSRDIVQNNGGGNNNDTTTTSRWSSSKSDSYLPPPSMNAMMAGEYLNYLDLSVQNPEKSREAVHTILHAPYDWRHHANQRLLCDVAVSLKDNFENDKATAAKLISYVRKRSPVHWCLSNNVYLATDQHDREVTDRVKFETVLRSAFPQVAAVVEPLLVRMNWKQEDPYASYVGDVFADFQPLMNIPLKGYGVKTEADLGRWC
ncbi:unnamed protein product [Amoebophrya sp. A120]|nr:unnamed protein product [Amoebophrya sp. A120]|eukprot:GSA120T00000328001.1